MNADAGSDRVLHLYRLRAFPHEYTVALGRRMWYVRRRCFTYGSLVTANKVHVILELVQRPGQSAFVLLYLCFFPCPCLPCHGLPREESSRDRSAARVPWSMPLFRKRLRRRLGRRPRRGDSARSGSRTTLLALILAVDTNRSSHREACTSLLVAAYFLGGKR